MYFQSMTGPGEERQMENSLNHIPSKQCKNMAMVNGKEWKGVKIQSHKLKTVPLTDERIDGLITHTAPEADAGLI